MGEITDDAIILDAIPYQDRHQVLSALTAGHGLVRGVLRGSRGGKTPSASATQILSRVRIDIFRAPTAELATFRNVDLVRPSFALAETLERSAAAAVISELIITFCPPSAPVPRHFRLADAVTRALLAGLDPAGLVAYTELWVLALEGILPPLDTCAACAAPLVDPPRLRTGDGHPLCPRCATPSSPTLDAKAMAFLRACLQAPPERVAVRPAPGQVAGWLDRLVRNEADRPIRALEFFRRVMGTEFPRP